VAVTGTTRTRVAMAGGTGEAQVAGERWERRRRRTSGETHAWEQGRVLQWRAGSIALCACFTSVRGQWVLAAPQASMAGRGANGKAGGAGRRWRGGGPVAPPSAPGKGKGEGVATSLPSHVGPRHEATAGRYV